MLLSLTSEIADRFSHEELVCALVSLIQCHHMKKSCSCIPRIRGKFSQLLMVKNVVNAEQFTSEWGRLWKADEEQLYIQNNV